MAMARCDYCDSYILFGGTHKSGRTFCSDNCLLEGRLMIAADRLPQHVVDDQVDEIHQGDCPKCGGAGPVDVHTSHTVWSIIALTFRRSTPNVCCRSCGRQKQIGGFFMSGAFGWWGFPWGFIYTPIQLCKNLSGIFGGPDPEVPSEQLELLIRLDLAARVDAGEPLPKQRRRPQKSERTAPADDRILVECDDCGKRFKAKAEMAGKSRKCPGCGSPILVPEADEWLSDDEVHETEDEWGGDSYDEYGNDDDNPYADDWEEPSSSRRSTAAKRTRKPKKKTWTPVKIGLVLGLGFAALNILGLLVGVVLAMFNDDPDPPQFGQNNPIVVPNVAPPDIQRNGFQNRPETQLPDQTAFQQSITPPPVNQGFPPNHPAVNNAIAGSTPQPTIPQPTNPQ
jgi:DNA-directed RNA polymerase subunit RPC12/RpoP